MNMKQFTRGTNNSNWNWSIGKDMEVLGHQISFDLPCRNANIIYEWKCMTGSITNRCRWFWRLSAHKVKSWDSSWLKDEIVSKFMSTMELEGPTHHYRLLYLSWTTLRYHLLYIPFTEACTDRKAFTWPYILSYKK